MSIQAIIAYAFGLLLIYLIAQTMLTPIKFVGRLLINSLLGGLLLLAVNFVGRGFSFHIGVNPASALTVGLLGIPGGILLIVLNLMLR